MDEKLATYMSAVKK
jgi:hypothetical protein